MNKLLTSLLVCVLLAGCGAVTPIVPTTPPTSTPTRTLMATNTSTLTSTPPTITSSPLSPLGAVEATFVAYRTAIANVCPTTTPSSGNDGNVVVLSDAQILREFAGVYGMNTGFESLSLVINCDGTFIGSSFHDVGGGLFHAGNVSVKDGKIYLNITDENSWALPKVLIPVRWGQRKYLVEDFLVDFFCEATTFTNDMKEPRSDSSFGFFLLRYGDEKLDGIGFPISPSGIKICP